MRKHIGTAYSRSPAENLGQWMTENSLRLLSAFIAAVIFSFIVNWLVDDLFNFLATQNDPTAEEPFSSDTGIVESVKIGGSLILAYFICRKQG